MAYKDDYLMHFGISGMHWGVRRYQNYDRTLTEEGKKRYGAEGSASANKTKRDLNRIDRESTVSKARAETYHARSAASEYAAKKRLSKGKNGKITSWYANNAKKYKIQADEYDRLAKEGRDFIKTMLDFALKSGKSVYSKNVYRYSGHDQNGYEKYTVGKKYRVKDDGLAKRTHNPNGLSENAQMLIMRYYYYY